jgi:hypothetical protein
MTIIFKGWKVGTCSYFGADSATLKDHWSLQEIQEENTQGRPRQIAEKPVLLCSGIPNKVGTCWYYKNRNGHHISWFGQPLKQTWENPLPMLPRPLWPTQLIGRTVNAQFFPNFTFHSTCSYPTSQMRARFSALASHYSSHSDYSWF